jgi:hypothetical protein
VHQQGSIPPQNSAHQPNNTVEQGNEHNPAQSQTNELPNLMASQGNAPEHALTSPAPAQQQASTPPPEAALTQPRRSGRESHAPNHLAFLAADQIIIPKNEREALAGPQAKEWKSAINEELAALAEMNTWTLAELPHGSKAIGTKWAFDIKQSVDGQLVRYKARLVAKGYAQRPGMDYDEVFAPVAKHATIRYILSMAADPSAHLAQLDVSTAFLNGVVEEELYCSQPPGFERDHRVCRMWKCLYGLK